MKIEEFKAGRYKLEYKYKSFIPNKINHEWVWTEPKINSLPVSTVTFCRNLIYQIHRE